MGYRVCVVGSGTRFLSGISYYTLRLTNALAVSHHVSSILMRQLLPTFAYPGRRRVGTKLTDLRPTPHVRVLDGVDWYWLPSMLRAFAFLLTERPDVLVFQWWTATVIHSYLALALLGRVIGSRIVIEFHEVLDPGELGILPVRAYVRLLGPALVTLAHGCVVHSEHDRAALEERYSIQTRPIVTIPHGPYDQYTSALPTATRSAPASACNLLYFGVIRPYKGVEDLICAFDSIDEADIERFWLTVVGETWEGWTLPEELIARSRYRDRITFVNRYVNDCEVAEFFGGADAVVLPYIRSSSSGPLHIAMAHGLPIVVTRVGGLTEAVANYAGVHLVPAQDPRALQAALMRLPDLRGQRFTDPHSWSFTAERYTWLLDQVCPRRPLVETLAMTSPGERP